MSRHTVGPWAMDQVAGGFNVGVTKTTETFAVWQRIARVGGELDEHSSKDVQQANACLIAAAPDLLAACREALNVATVKLDIYAASEVKQKEVVALIEDAIAKATEEEVERWVS